MEGPIYLVAVGHGDQPESLLRRQLSYVNYQLLSALTGGTLWHAHTYTHTVLARRRCICHPFPDPL